MSKWAAAIPRGVCFMSDPIPNAGTAPAPVPAPADPGAPAPAPSPAPAPADPAGNAPKWEGDFDPERAARLVANLRGENESLKAKFGEAQTKLTEYEQAQLSEVEKATQRAAQLEADLKAARRESAVSAALRKHGLSDDDAEFLTGETPEEIDAKAAKLAARAGATPATDPAPLPATLPVPGNGTDPAAVRQLTREEIEGMNPTDIMAAYRAGRLREIGGK